MSKALALVLEQRTNAENEVERVLRRDYPPGKALRWNSNGIHEGIVLDKASYDRIRVKNTRTGNEYWIHAYTIVDAMGE